MKKNGQILIDASTLNSDLLYKVGVIISDPFIYFKIDNKEFVVVKSLEYSRVKKFANKDIKTLLPEDITGTAEIGADNKNIVKCIIEKYNIGSFNVPKNFPVYFADFIRSMNVKLNVIENDYFPEREVKNECEIQKIETAVRSVESCMCRVETILRESEINKDNLLVWNNELLTSEILHREVDFEAIKNNASAKDTIIASGIDSSQPHNVGSGPIKACTPIVVDIFPRMNNTGYWGDMTRTFVKGKAPEIVKKAYNAVSEAKEAAKKVIKTGISSLEVHNLAKSVLEKNGFQTGKKDGEFYGFFHSLGHGVGLDIHEAPLLGPRSDKPLKTNAVVTVEPGVYYKEWGGVRLEDMVIVKEDGIECLTDYPEILEIN